MFVLRWQAKNSTRRKTLHGTETACGFFNLRNEAHLVLRQSTALLLEVAVQVSFVAELQHHVDILRVRKGTQKWQNVWVADGTVDHSLAVDLVVVQGA